MAAVGGHLDARQKEQVGVTRLRGAHEVELRHGVVLRELDKIEPAAPREGGRLVEGGRRVAALARDLAIKHGTSAEEARLVHVAGLVHDIGKIGVSEAILLKPGKLTPEERVAINEHPEIGYRILKDVPQLAGVLGGVRHHHERWDGTGYGHGLAGTDIPISARMIALADTFDAMCSSRTHR